MRAAYPIALLLLAACSDRAERQPSTPGESREAIKPRGGPEVTIRSGAEVPVVLPGGFSLYPGATVVANTVVERKGGRRGLIEFETSDDAVKIANFYRLQARAAGARITLDIAGDAAASLGGTLREGGRFALTASKGRPTRAELAFD